MQGVLGGDRHVGATVTNPARLDKRAEGIAVMKGMTFANFVADENNQAAFDICRKVASLKGDAAKPITLVGEKGTGKSHLLWAIVNDFREHQARVGVALVSASEFPQKVRNLVNNPAPIQKNRAAALLVDELELFKENAPELEAVVRTFLDNGHMVVLASRIHPSALSGYSGKFKALLSSGSIVGMQATGATSADGGMSAFALERIAGLKLTIGDLEKERDQFKAMLDNAGGNARDGGGSAQLEAERDRIREALERSEGDLLETRQELATARESAERAVSLAAALSEKMAGAERAQRARIEALDQALAGLDQDLEVLAGNGPAEGDPALAAYDSLVAEKHAAEAQLDKARREATQSMARASVRAGEVQRLLDRTAALLSESDEDPALAEARRTLDEAIVRLAGVSSGASGTVQDETEEGGTGLLPKRGMPGGEALTDVVKKAFGDPVEDDEDDDDFTYAEPAPEEDESEPDPNRL
jgi:hypothetical protein